MPIPEKFKDVILGFVAVVIMALGMLYLGALFGPVRAEEKGRCIQVDPASLVWTRMGWSLAVGDGQATVSHNRVRYWDGPLAYCIPQSGMPELWMPSRAWPPFAAHNSDGAGRIHLAHYEWSWIRKRDQEIAQEDGGWRQGDFGPCCGPSDCFAVRADYEVREIDGKKVPGFVVRDEFNDFVPLGKPHSDVSRDPEGRNWRCYRMDGDRKLAPRAGCFFYQPGGN